MLKTVICIENYVETACWKFQCVLKTVMHVENYVEISRCVENVYFRHVENRGENCVEIRKNHHHTLRCVLKLSGRGPKIRRQTARFDSEFTRVSEVRHIFFAGHRSVLGGHWCHCFGASSPAHNRFHRFNSGAITPDLLVASMAGESFHPHTCVQALVELEFVI